MTIERPMFPPRAPSRRQLLSDAAGIAAVGAVAAYSGLPASQAAASPPDAVKPTLMPLLGPLSGAEASPALRAASVRLREASDALDSARAAFKIQDDLAVDWQKKHPAPSGDPRKLKRWFRLAADYRRSTQINPAWDAQVAAEEAFAAAQIEVAKVVPNDMVDLALKACLAFAVEEGVHLAAGNTHVIARSLALNLGTMAVAS